MSAILSADDLNDFIGPGAACVKPVETPKPEGEAGEVDIQIDENGNPLEISKIDGRVSTLSPAQISLADCLACSGCITSAEEVLVAQHSHDQLINALDNREDKVFVASISHQSRASFAHAFGFSIDEMDKLLINLLRNQMGFKYVVGTALGRKLSLLEEAQNMRTKKNSGSSNGPTLSSICPGWVLYAEKTHPHILPLMSATKSPQQITGCLLKSLVSRELNISRDKIYHLSIMPCFDKKLESARPEQTPIDDSAPDVDCVLTAKEVINLLEQSKYELVPSNAHKIIQLPGNVYRGSSPSLWPFKELSWSNDSGSQSGGYAYNYLMIFKNQLIAENPEIYSEESFSIKNIEGRNSDIYEMRLMHGETKVASAAIVNGFKNIQNLVRKLKPSPAGTKSTKTNPLASRRRARMNGKSPSSSEVATEVADASKCDYVEVMACPNGCINGGGQISKPQDASEKEWLSQVKDIYSQIDTLDLSSENSDQLVEKLATWSASFCKENEVPHDRLFNTYFNEVEKPTDPNAILLGAKW